MNRLNVDRIPLFIGASGAFAAAITFAVANAWVAFGAAVGAILALINFYIYRWIADRVTSGTIRKQAVLSLLLVAKILVLMVLVYFLITRNWVDPLGFIVGLGALVVGLLLGSIQYLFASQSTSSEQ